MHSSSPANKAFCILLYDLFGRTLLHKCSISKKGVKIKETITSLDLYFSMKKITFLEEEKMDHLGAAYPLIITPVEHCF